MNYFAHDQELYRHKKRFQVSLPSFQVSFSPKSDQAAEGFSLGFHLLVVYIIMLRESFS